MTRRNFIKLSANTALLLACSGVATPLWAGDNTTTPKTVINVMLDGGPDFRHLIVPAYASDNNDPESYATKFWQARSSIFNVSSVADLKTAYSENYDEITVDGITCGILKQCAWLKDEIVAGNVAIINNVIASTNRDHHHSQMMIEHGSVDTNAHNQDVSGWAGRAAKELGGNVVSVSREVRLVCNGPHPTNLESHDNSCVVSNYDSRDMGLTSYDTQADLDGGSSSYKWSEKAKLSRALSSYYALKEPLVPQESIYRKFVDHEKQLRAFGALLQTRLDTVPIPTALSNLYEGDTPLDSTDFGKQVLSVYDSYATQDILNMRLASMEYKGWDSHKNLRDQIEPQFEDMFGATKGFHSLISEFVSLKSDAYNNTVIVISGEFGRQLKSNGSEGNDHGRGNSMIVIGGKVNGGFYGEPFPADELAKLDVKNEDILGKTSMFQVYATILDWQESNLGSKVFDLTDQEVESGVDLSTMITI